MERLQVQARGVQDQVVQHTGAQNGLGAPPSEIQGPQVPYRDRLWETISQRKVLWKSELANAHCDSSVFPASISDGFGAVHTIPTYAGTPGLSMRIEQQPGIVPQSVVISAGSSWQP